MPLNHSYRLVFNETLGSWVAAPETAKARGKGGRRSAAVVAAVSLMLGGLAGTANAAGPLPTGGAVVGGSGTITQNGAEMTVRQTSQRMAADWQTFSVGEGNTVRFVQPGASSVALNRVLGPDPSVIQGKLAANGQVFLVNPNGVLFSPTAQVNVGGLVASTLQMSVDDFMAGRYRFDGNSNAAVTNQGKMAAAEGGYVALVAARIVNDGQISTPKGSALLGAGQTVTLDLGGPVRLQVERGALQAQITNGGAIEAAGGQILLTAKAAGDLASAVINQTGHLEATSLATDARGRIVLIADGGAIVNTGTISASGTHGGTIQARSRALIDAGHWQATGSQGAGGQIEWAAAQHLEQTAASRIDASGELAGGSVRATSGDSAWLSGQLRADSAQGQGGDVSTTAQTLTVAGATLTADGRTGGGRVRVGGGWQGGDADLANAGRTTVTDSTSLGASATGAGSGGTVVIWSDKGTGAAARITARGAGDGDGGRVEVSSHGQLAYAASVDVAAAGGKAGLVLLDPKNVVIDGSPVPMYTVTSLADPSPTAGDEHGGGGLTELANGNILVRSSRDDTVASNSGAVRLYTPSGILLSTLTGSSANEQIGNGSVTKLSNGNFVITSHSGGAGAVTWGSATTGVSGAVSAANSLLGSAAGDNVGNSIVALPNGNYLVVSPLWANGSETRAGAVTFGNGATGTSGVVGSANSLVGTLAASEVGYDVKLLASGNYIVLSPNWSYETGAVTWGSGTAGVKGEVSAANSLVGSNYRDNVGENRNVHLLSNGNYVVASPDWTNGSRQYAGAVTWGSGTSGVAGAISASNSLVGINAQDRIGSYITDLGNGKYVIASPNWSPTKYTNTNNYFGPTDVYFSKGAVTLADGSAAITGTISASNSLVGTGVADAIGAGRAQSLGNGNFVVMSPNYGAEVTSTTTNYYGGCGLGYPCPITITVHSTINPLGAATFVNGATGLTGNVSAANSLVGSRPNDRVGSSIAVVADGNYVIASPYWTNGSATSAGAATWGSGASGVRGEVSAANSLVGSRANDQVGWHGVHTLANGNYVVASPNWDSATAMDVGAATWGNGASGIVGAVSSGNSLVGTVAGSQVGSGVAVLENGNYVVTSTRWNPGAAINAGAVTFGDGSTGITGAVSAANSLVGSSAGDRIGYFGVRGLANGNYVVNSPYWKNGANDAAGAVTWGSGTTGVSGVVSASNSLVGAEANSMVGLGGVSVLNSGNYLVYSYQWRNATQSSLGAFTWGSGTTGISGEVSASNSLVGGTPGDSIGNGGFRLLADGNYVIMSPSWSNGSATAAGAVTWGSGASGVSGVVSEANSLVGSTMYDRVGSGGIVELTGGRFAVQSSTWSDTAASRVGAVTIATGAIAGRVSAANSFIGAAANDLIGSGGLFALSDGRVAVSSPNANGTAGRVDIIGLGGPSIAASYADNPAATSTISAAQIASVLGTGANLVLQASNDITVASAINVANASGDGGDLTLQAGRSVLVNAGITTDNGNLTLIANDTAANGVIDAHRDAGTAAILMANGTVIDAGNGAVSMEMRDGAGKTQRASGDITLATVRGADLLLDSINFTGRFSVQGKVYDGTTLAITQPGVFVDGLGFASGSNLSMGGVTATFDSKGVGARIATANQGLSIHGFNGAAGSELKEAGARIRPTAPGMITARALNVTATASDKVYDGSTAAAVTYGSDVIGTDLLAISGTAAFGNKNVGVDKAVNVTGLGITGADAGNYVLASDTMTATADITARTLTVTASAQNKIYDGTTAAAVTYGSDKIATDVVAVSGSAAFGNKNVGVDKAVNVTGLGITGADAGNYVLASSTTTVTADITARALNVTATGQDKVYDGTTAAAVGFGSDKISSDMVTIAGTGAFGDKNVGTDKVVSVTGIGITGADAGNYVLASGSAATTADITVRTLNVTATGQDKVYDGTTAAAVGFGSDKIGSDVVMIAGTAAFSDKNVGTNKPVTVTGIGIAGTDAGNYVLASGGAATTADITARTLNVTATGQDKVYNGGTGATVSFGSNKIGNDAVTITGTAAFGDKNVGIGKDVSVTGIGITGAEAANYVLVSATAAATADITPRPLNVTATAQDKVYDGTTAATASYGDDRVAGDTLGISGTASFSDKNAGTGKAVSVSGLGISGADAGNYTISSASAATTASITPRILNVTATGQDKVYDGTVAATASYRDDRVAGDALAISGTAAFADRNAGTGKAVAVTGIALGGADAGNYALGSTATATTASITPRPLDVAGSRDFDGTTLFTAAVLSAGNVVAGDTVGLSGDADVASSQAGSYAALTRNGLVSSNANYATSGGAVNLTIRGVAPAPIPAPGQALPRSLSVGDVLAAILLPHQQGPQGEETQAAPAGAGGGVREQAETPNHRGAAAAGAATALRLQIIDGGIRLPADAASTLNLEK